MPTHGEKYHGQWFSSNGRWYSFKIYHKGHTSAAAPLKVGGGGVKLKYDTSGQDKFSPIMASKCTISLMVENNPFGQNFENFLDILRTTAEEGDATFVIWNSSGGTPLWSGNILLDLSAKEDVSKPYEIELSATDGLGLLKNYDMVKTQGATPYASADTYISDGYQTFIYWIKEILEFCNTPDSDSTDGDVMDYTFSTSVDWWYEDHPAPDPSVSPLAHTKCQMLATYKITDDLKYEVKSVYDILEGFCKIWGMRVVFWKNNFYFVQIELYNTPDAGNYATPDNVDTQVFSRAGVFTAGRSYLGDSWFSLYTQDISTNAGGFEGGLQKLAGSKWDYYPKLKSATADFSSTGDGYYNGFPPVVTTTSTGTEVFSSSSIGTFTDASAFSGLLVNVVLSINSTNNYAANGDIIWNWSIRARQSGTSPWTKYFENGAWATYPTVAGGVPPTLFQYQNHIISTTFHTNTPAQTGTWEETIYNGTIPSDAAFTGDWEFEFFTHRVYIGLDQGGTPAPISYGNFCVEIWNSNFGETGESHNLTYQDAIDPNTGNIKSYVMPVLGTSTGANINTQVITNTSETEHVDIKNLWWGDTVTYGDTNSLIWTDDSGNSGYTDPAGLWRNGQSGSFNKTITELLCEARLFNQQQSDYKWSLSTAVSSINSWKNDGTGSRPVYVNPVGRIHDTRQQIFYYMLRGGFNLLNDEWDGEWLEISYNDSISTTTTTTQTGGSNPSNDTGAAARQGSPPQNAARISRQFFLTRLSAELRAGTITSLSIVDQQVTLSIKSGDKITLFNNTTAEEFEVSADVGSTDTTISVTSKTTTVDYPIGTNISIGGQDLFTQYQHQDRGTVGGMTVAASQMGPITIDGEGNYTIDAEVINGVDLDYIKLIPSDFIGNADNTSKYWQFADTGTTGVRISNANTELWAMAAIPYGKKATHVTVWGNNTKVVEAYELDVNASGVGTALGSGTVGTEFSITNLSSDTTNYLGVKVITTGTSNRIYGGKITLANI